MILDSNLVIYSTLPGYPQLRRLIADARPAVSAVSRVEVLGYHKITPAEKQQLEATFAALEVLPVTDAVIDRAVLFRQSRKLSLGDALIAATAILEARELKTRNLKDFAGIPGLVVSDPLAGNGPA